MDGEAGLTKRCGEFIRFLLKHGRPGKIVGYDDDISQVTHGCYLVEICSFSNISEIDNAGALMILTPGGRFAIIGKYPPFLVTIKNITGAFLVFAVLYKYVAAPRIVSLSRCILIWYSRKYFDVPGAMISSNLTSVYSATFVTT
jgi:hypothetical protein